MDDVLNMGRKDGKYMKFRPSRAPLFGREFTTMSDYNEKDLLSHQANKMLAQKFSTLGNEATAQPNLVGNSTFSESYVQYSRKQSKIAKLPAQGPNRRERTKMPGSASDSMLVTKSFAQDQHKEPLNASGLPPARVTPTRPPDNLHINPRSMGTFQTGYMSDFQVSPMSLMFGQRPLSLPATPGFPGLQPTCRPDVWNKSRNILLRPGQ